MSLNYGKKDMFGDIFGAKKELKDRKMITLITISIIHYIVGIVLIHKDNFSTNYSLEYFTKLYVFTYSSMILIVLMYLCVQYLP